MCKCINKISKVLKQKFGETVKLEIAFMINPKTGKSTEKPKPLYFYYNKKKPNGELEKKLTKSFLGFEYCPFCGIKYWEK